MKLALLGLTITAAILTGHAIYNTYYSQKANLRDYHNEFHLWRKINNHPGYSSLEEEKYRLMVWINNANKVEKHNQIEGSSYKMGMNQFADLTSEEFTKRYTGLNINKLKNALKNKKTVKLQPKSIESVDWVKKGKVTRVKNQLDCGGCWAFSTTAALESYNMIHNSAKKQSFSPQYMIDCDVDAGDHGCDGGEYESAFGFTIDNGVVPYRKYPYKAREGRCQKTKMARRGLIKYVNNDFELLPENDNDSLVAAIQNQPVSVAIDGSGVQLYTNGVFDGDCTPNVNHAVLAVGYGEENGKKFYKIKNSWGTSYGEKGYVKILRDDGMNEGKCGVAVYTVYPTWS